MANSRPLMEHQRRPCALSCAAAVACLFALICPALAAQKPAKKGKDKSLGWWDQDDIKDTGRPVTPGAEPAADGRLVGRRAPSRPADDDAGFRIALGLFGGGDFYSSNLDLGNNNRTLGLSPIDSSVWGARLGVDMNIFSIQVEATLASSKYFEGAVASADLRSIRATALAHYPLGSFRPFLLFGGGWWTLANDPAPMKADTDAVIHFGGGVRWNMYRSLGLRLEGRGMVSDGHDSGSASMNWSLLCGLSYRLFAD